MVWLESHCLLAGESPVVVIAREPSIPSGIDGKETEKNVFSESVFFAAAGQRQ
jgi:hypothetical protein